MTEAECQQNAEAQKAPNRQFSIIKNFMNIFYFNNTHGELKRYFKHISGEASAVIMLVQSKWKPQNKLFFVCLKNVF